MLVVNPRGGYKLYFTFSQKVIWFEWVKVLREEGWLLIFVFKSIVVNVFKIIQFLQNLKPFHTQMIYWNCKKLWFLRMTKIFFFKRNQSNGLSKLQILRTVISKNYIWWQTCMIKIFLRNQRVIIKTFEAGLKVFSKLIIFL